MTVEPPTQSDGLIRLNLRPPTMGSGRHAPWVQVDGVQIPAKVGDNLLEVSAGPHLVQVAPRWDPARVRALHVHVGPGAVVPVFYADPASRFFGGSLGTRYRQDWALRCLQAWGVLMLIGLLVGFIRA
ncbi:hypothetical protein AAII07_35220 [Microvirga sp. 0TCS3.31]